MTGIGRVTWGAAGATPWHQRGCLIHCMPGWRAGLCVLDNLVPHCALEDAHLEPDEPPIQEACRGFRWVCRLHDWVGTVGSFDRES